MKPLVAALVVAACAHSFPGSNEPGTVVDRGTFELFSQSEQGKFGTESFTVVDRAGGGHVLVGETTFSRGGSSKHKQVRLVTDAAWHPVEGRLEEDGGVLLLARDGDQLVIKSVSGAIGTRETAPSDLFGNDLLVLLEPLCDPEVNGRTTLSVFPGSAITVAATAMPEYTSVSIQDGWRLELLCDQHKLIVVNGGGLLAVREGYAKAAREMLDAIGQVRN